MPFKNEVKRKKQYTAKINAAFKQGFVVRTASFECCFFFAFVKPRNDWQQRKAENYH